MALKITFFICSFVDIGSAKNATHTDAQMVSGFESVWLFETLKTCVYPTEYTIHSIYSGGRGVETRMIQICYSGAKILLK